MIWLQPAVLWALAAVALPIAIHLLARARSRRMLFPSLKFLRESQVAALRRRAVDDWPLLIVRVLVVAAATAALAAPVFVSAGRRAAWDRRVARAIVIVPGSAAAARLADEEAAASFVHRKFDMASATDAIEEAVGWLGQQPPAAREVVIIGDLREGVLGERALAGVPSFAGIRFLPLTQESAASDVQLAGVSGDAAGRLRTMDVRVTPETERTRARYEVKAVAAVPHVRMAAAAADQAVADAILRAVMREGVIATHAADRNVTIAFAGASVPDVDALAPPQTPWMRDVLVENPDVRGGEANGGLVVRVPTPVTSPAAGATVSRVLASTFDVDLRAHEPRRIVPATLARWSRAPGQSPADAKPVDERDRRWLWGATLALLGVEQLLRRSRARERDERPSMDRPSDGTAGAEDVRVA